MNAAVMMHSMNDIARIAASEDYELEPLEVLWQILDSNQTANLSTSPNKNTIHTVTHRSPTDVLRIIECSNRFLGETYVPWRSRKQSLQTSTKPIIKPSLFEHLDTRTHYTFFSLLSLFSCALHTTQMNLSMPFLSNMCTSGSVLKHIYRTR